MAQCSICFAVPACPVRLPCTHEFCRSCLFTWLLKEETCPLCRAHTSASMVTTCFRARARIAFWAPLVVWTVAFTAALALGVFGVLCFLPPECARLDSIMYCTFGTAGMLGLLAVAIWKIVRYERAHAAET